MCASPAHQARAPAALPSFAFAAADGRKNVKSVHSLSRMLFICLNAGEVPVGDCYGTSIPLAHALDPASDVLLAWEHNGAPLSPHHGAPLRVIVPGFIGGRSMKWLAGIEVTQARKDGRRSGKQSERRCACVLNFVRCCVRRLLQEPSRNHYHTHDNRILPPDVTQERADAEGALPSVLRA
jgi:DMSO/TMAO reductase YedYZ molybdopterin-dependent catalytic subunit